MRALLILSLLTLAACGADGEPVPPDPKPSGPGISVGITGTAKMGISG